MDILNLLKGSDTPAADQKTFLKAQILFWLLGATDGHGKNFSIHLGPGGRFTLTPLYDVLSAQPSLDSRLIVAKKMKLAMSVGKNRHYTLGYIKGHHFAQSCERAGLPEALAHEALEEVAQSAASAIGAVQKQLPDDFPTEIRSSVERGLMARLAAIGVAY